MTTALDVNDKITAGFPTSTGYGMIADRVHDVGRVDVTASATAGRLRGFLVGCDQPDRGGDRDLVFGAVA